MRRAFTLIEVLVATVLLAMLVTILTMVFNQSSVAWTTGVASVTALGDMREDMSVYAAEAENALLGDDGSTVLRVTSIWDENGQGLKKDGGRTLTQTFEKPAPGRDALRDKQGFAFNGGSNNEIQLNGNGANGQQSFLVGVHSYGPDGQTGGDRSWDDISTLPEEVVK